MNDPTFPTPVRGIESSSSSSPITTTPSAAGGTPQLSPSVVVIIVLITVVFFLSGFLHLLARCFRPGGSPGNNSQPRRNNSSASLNSYQGQLQQLFHLHDSGVEQAFIDALPVFLYRAVRGLKDGADCAVCLNEFSGDDRLRLLPKCSHAFHIECIDTWLLSHSTCPLCRCSLVPDHHLGGPGSSVGLRVESFGASSVASTTVESLATVSEHNVPQQQEEQEESQGESRVQQLIPVKLGRFNTNPGFNPGSRRSYSMGSYEYVLDSSAGGGEQVVAVALISPTPMHKKWLPRGTPGHRAALSESVPGREYPSGGSPWVTIDIDPRPMLEQQGGATRGSFLSWAPWRRGASRSSVGEKSFDSERGKSFSFRLGAGDYHEQQHQQDSGAAAVWWWKNRGSSSMRSEANDQRPDQNAGASAAVTTHGTGAGAASWDQASICSTNAEMKSTGSGASSMTTVSIARRTLQWLMGRDKHHHRNSEDLASVY